jgi:Ni,Fe-hydrogenase III small subunit
MYRLLRRLVQKPMSTRKETPGHPARDHGTGAHGSTHSLFRRSLAIREVDCGSDNAAEMELGSLSGPWYDLEQYGISFVASPRHADALIVTGAVTMPMADALIATYEATPDPKLVIAVGDDACTGGIFQGSYAVKGGVDQVIPVDYKIQGNPPSPDEILDVLLRIMRETRER